jgi:branched-chain amino acid transport system permease protein
LNNEIIYALILAIFSITLLLIFFLRYSSVGMALQGIGENDEAAEHIGINVTRIKILTFSCSAIFMGATGAVMASRWRYIDPSIAFDPLLSFLPVLMAIFGGTSRLEGPILGAVIFTLLREFLITKYPHHFMLLMGLTLIIVILFLPGGLIALAMRGWIYLQIQWANTKFRWQTLKNWWRDLKPKLNMVWAQWRLRMLWRMGRRS